MYSNLWWSLPSTSFQNSILFGESKKPDQCFGLGTLFWSANFFQKDFILIKILIKIRASTSCLDFILIKIHLSGGHAGATTSPAEDSEGDGGAPFVSRPAQPCPPCQVRGGTCGGTAFDILAWNALDFDPSFWLKCTLFWSKFWKMQCFSSHFILNRILKNIGLGQGKERNLDKETTPWPRWVLRKR